MNRWVWVIKTRSRSHPSTACWLITVSRADACIWPPNNVFVRCLITLYTNGLPYVAWGESGWWFLLLILSMAPDRGQADRSPALFSVAGFISRAPRAQPHLAQELTCLALSLEPKCTLSGALCRVARPRLHPLRALRDTQRAKGDPTGTRGRPGEHPRAPVRGLDASALPLDWGNFPTVLLHAQIVRTF